MEQIVVYSIMTFGVLAYVMAVIAFRHQKNRTASDIIAHNRKVMLGVKEPDWDVEIKEECTHTEDFFLLENSGTYDTSYLSDCIHIPFMKEEDLFLEDLKWN